jgi:serine/threonine protein kinase/Tol biopolymer transport system component
MSLAPGVHLGPYEIAALIGAGGMGEVYKARDTRLNRDVAVKILPASFAADRERVRRFQTEAEAVAALSHPNILAVYDLGEYDGVPYLVSELLDGEALSALLARGVPSHRKSTAYAVQIAQGLAAAHSRNIAHRDLKPDNIYITREGQVKILDFGLAKSVVRPGHAASPDDLTLASSRPATDAGTVMGTVGYMSPEQVRGSAVDTRTDIFSFGAVFFEMLTGVRAFKRGTPAETMTAILNDEPPETLESSRQIPPALDRIIRHCLEKSPDHRFQSSRDLAFDLESASNLTASGGLPTAKGRTQYGWWRYAAAALAIGLIAAFSIWRFPAGSKPVIGTQFHQITYRLGELTDARFTPDGQIVYTAEWNGKPEIYTVPANESGGHSLGIANARLLAVSKTGEIAVALSPRIVTRFITPGTLARASNGSGAPKPEIENIVQADYTPDGSALAIVRYLPDQAKCQLEYPVGKALYTAPAITDVRFSPNGKYLAFIPHENPFDDRGTAVILGADGTKVATSAVYESAEGLAWTPRGDEIWFSSPLESGQVLALSLSGRNREVFSVPGRLFLRDIAANGRLLAEQGISHLGIMVSTGKGSVQRDLSWLDYGFVRAISDDGQMILFEEEGAEHSNYTIYVRNTDGSSAVPIGEGYGADLSHDKNWVLSERLNGEVWLLPVGAGEPKRVSPPGFNCVWAKFLPDGKAAVLMAAKDNRPLRIWVQNLDGGNPRPVSPEHIMGVLASPDSKWVLGGRDSDLTQRETLLVPIDGGSPVPIAGLQPTDYSLGWTADGRLYVGPQLKAGDTSINVAILDPHSGKRSAWRDIPLIPLGEVHAFGLTISPDGSSYAYGYGLQLADLYTITRPR